MAGMDATTVTHSLLDQVITGRHADEDGLYLVRSLEMSCPTLHAQTVADADGDPFGPHDYAVGAVMYGNSVECPECGEWVNFEDEDLAY